MPERLDIDVLRTLKAIQDYGGVTKAAEYLSLTQSAVSHKIRRFENSIGCQLLRRKPGQGLLTNDGKQLAAYAEKIISIHDEALLGINKPALKGSIYLGITEEMVTSGLASVLGRFGRLYSGVKVKTRVEQSLPPLVVTGAGKTIRVEARLMMPAGSPPEARPAETSPQPVPDPTPTYRSRPQDPDPNERPTPSETTAAQIFLGRLGLIVAELTEEAKSRFGFEGDGVLVDKVGDGPFKQQGVRVGDILIAVEVGEDVHDLTSVRMLRGLGSGLAGAAELHFMFLRDDELTAVLIEN